MTVLHIAAIACFWVALGAAAQAAFFLLDLLNTPPNAKITRLHHKNSAKTAVRVSIISFLLLLLINIAIHKATS